MRFLYVLILFCVPVTIFAQCVGVNNCEPKEATAAKPVTYNSVDTYTPEGGVTVKETGTCTIAVTVPADAVVHINGRPTTSKGAERNFKSVELKDGLNYKYTITVYTKEKGQWYEQTETIIMQKGTSKSLTFE